MNPLFGLALVLIGFLLGWDWLVKRWRTARRPEISSEEFLNAYSVRREVTTDAEILEIRRRIARELGVPVCKISPADNLIELSDRFSLVGNGDLALADLLDDLHAVTREATTTTLVYPETVRDYIATFLDHSVTSDRGV
jgi:hypothetical protein